MCRYTPYIFSPMKSPLLTLSSLLIMTGSALAQAKPCARQEF